ncbi:MAG: hypothetical protein ABIG84_07015 [archaeon]
MGINERQRIINEIKSDLMLHGNPEIISIIFNDDEEICTEDYKKINREIFQNIKSKKAAIIYHGDGGETNAGFGLGIALRTKFNKGLMFLLPEKARSAHVLPILFSNLLYLDKDAYLTPVDPSLYHYSKHFSCCRLINDREHPLYKKAKSVYEVTASMVFETLRREGSLVIDPHRLDIKTENMIVEKFLNPKRHNIQLKYDDLRKMKLQVDLASDDVNTWKLIKKVHSMSILHLADQKKRYLVETCNKSLIC